MTPPADFRGFVCLFIDLIEILLPIVAAFALLAFFWGLIKFIYKSGDSGSHKEGRDLMIWGTIGLFVLISLYGILGFFYDDLGFSESRPFGIPSFLPQGSSNDNVNVRVCQG